MSSLTIEFESISPSNYATLKFLDPTLDQSIMTSYFFQINPATIKKLIDLMNDEVSKEKLYDAGYRNLVVSRLRNRLETYYYRNYQ